MGKINQPSDLYSIVRDLRRKVDALVKRVGLSSAVISSGGLRIEDGGSFKMIDNDGVEVVYFGPVDQSGEVASGWIFKNDAGIQMFTLSGTPDSQFWALRDSAGRIIVSNDANSGAGLGTPWLPLPIPQPTASAFETQSSSYVTVAVSYAYLQHPRFRAFLTGKTSAGAGNMRVLINGTQIGSAGTLSTTSSGLTINELIPNWGSSVLPFNQATIEVQARASAGGGAFAFVSSHYMYGGQS